MLGLLDRIFDFMLLMPEEHNKRILNKPVIRRKGVMNYKEILKLILTDKLEANMKKFYIKDLRKILEFKELIQDNFNDSAEEVWTLWELIKDSKQEVYSLIRSQEDHYKDFLYSCKHNQYQWDIEDLKKRMTKDLGESLDYSSERKFTQLKWIIKDAMLEDMELNTKEAA